MEDKEGTEPELGVGGGLGPWRGQLGCYQGQGGAGPASPPAWQDLSFNSFEQLCINYANENLQYLFNKIVFQEEQVCGASIHTPISVFTGQ